MKKALLEQQSFKSKAGIRLDEKLETALNVMFTLYADMLHDASSSSQRSSALLNMAIAQGKNRASIGARTSVKTRVIQSYGEDNRVGKHTRLVPDIKIKQARGGWGTAEESFMGKLGGKADAMHANRSPIGQRRRSSAGRADETHSTAMKNGEGPRRASTGSASDHPKVHRKARKRSTALQDLKPVDVRERVLSRHNSAAAQNTTRAAERIFQRKIATESKLKGKSDRRRRSESARMRKSSAVSAISAISAKSIKEAAEGGGGREGDSEGVGRLLLAGTASNFILPTGSPKGSDRSSLSGPAAGSTGSVDGLDTDDCAGSRLQTKGGFRRPSGNIPGQRTSVPSPLIPKESRRRISDAGRLQEVKSNGRYGDAVKEEELHEIVGAGKEP